MSTVVATACADAFVIGSETLLSQGDIRLSHDYGHNPKIHRIGDSCIGLTGTVAHYTALVQALRELGDQCQLWGQEQVFATFTRVHRKLKDEYFLNPKKQAEDAYESNHISAMVVNGSGLYGVYAHREVLVFGIVFTLGLGQALSIASQSALVAVAPTSRLMLKPSGLQPMAITSAPNSWNTSGATWYAAPCAASTTIFIIFL